MTNPVCNFPTVALELDAKDADLKKQIDNEVAARVNGDTVLQASIDAEVVTRTDADKQLQANIDAEATARNAADKDLQNQITAEITARTNADENEASIRASVDKDLQAQIDALKIAGTVQYFAMKTAPNGWLVADGSAVSRTTYVNLFNAIGTTYGEGDGSATFNLPDLRGEFIRGFDNGRGVDSERVFGSSQDATAIRTLIDRYSDHPIGILAVGMRNTDGTLEGSGSSNHTEGSNATFYECSTVAHNGVGDNWASKTRPRNVALLACIKY